MGWFWADSAAPPAAQVPHSHHRHRAFAAEDGAPPPGCPMHKKTVDAFNPSSAGQATSALAPPPAPHRSDSLPSSCPIAHNQPASEIPEQQPRKSQSTLSKLNPLNYMFGDLSQARAPNQTVVLPTSREASSIPRSTGEGNWEYPSPQQMYNALLRKGYTDTDATAVESMVAVHNFLNEGAWAEIVEWERRFGRGLSRGWQICRKGEEHAPELARQVESREGATIPTLVRFQGRPQEMTPKAAMIQVMGWLYPSKFGTEPPFDRHDWYVARDLNGQDKQVRYVIDFYSGPPEPTGEPVFYLDVRPAVTPTGAVERMMRWGGDVWWRASGGDARESGTSSSTD